MRKFPRPTKCHGGGTHNSVAIAPSRSVPAEQWSEEHMPRPPRQGKFPGLTDEELDAAITSSEEDDPAPVNPEDNLGEGEGEPAAEGPEEDDPAPENPEDNLGEGEEEPAAEGPEEELIEEEEGGPNMAVPTYRDMTFDIVTGNTIDMEYQKILCPHCMNREFYHIAGRVQKTNDGDKNILVGPAAGGDYVVALRTPGTPGQFTPRNRRGISDEVAQYLLDLHLTEEGAACVIQNDPVFVLQLKLAKDRIKKMDDMGEKGKKYYAETGQEYPKFDVDMTPEELKANLSSALNIANDNRWKWSTELKVEILTK